MKKNSIYLNALVDTSNPPQNASYITYDKQDGFKFWNSGKQSIIDKPVTAFEVMPTSEVIAAGTEDDVTGLTFTHEVPAATVMSFMLRSAVPATNNDVTIDWGDGCIEEINDGKYEFTGKGYQVSHDYAHSMKSSVQRFIVKIYGKDYYTFRTNEKEHSNIISRIFDIDLPVASHVGNFASMCYNANRLLKVAIPHSTKYITTAFNFASTFQFASNLKSVMGFEDSPLRNDCIVANIFNGCDSLEETDFKIPTSVTSIAGVFYSCKSLKAKIENLISANGFALDNVNVENAFGQTMALTGTSPANILWGTSKTFLSRNLKSTFVNSGVAASVIKSWGGTMEEPATAASAE